MNESKHTPVAWVVVSGGQPRTLHFFEDSAEQHVSAWAPDFPARDRRLRAGLDDQNGASEGA